LGEYIQDEKLLAVFSWLRSYCGTPLDRLPAPLILGMWSTYHFDGYYYFVGGSQAVSNALAEVIREQGGRIELRSRVAKIVVEEGRAVAVRTKDGREFACRYVVSNASAPATLNELVGRQFLPDDYLAELDRMRIGPSILQVFLGVDKDYREIFDGAHAISIFETYDYHEEARFWSEGDIEKVSFIIVNYSIADSTVAPAGKNIIQFTTYMPYDWRGGWYENVSYEKYRTLKDEVARVLIRRAEKVLPDLGSHIEVMEVGSPRTMEHYTLNPRGAVYGWTLDMTQPGSERLDLQTPIPNLLLAGVWTRSGHGQLSALASGRQAAEIILKKDR
jgi:prolycopene isomerase